MRTFSERIAVMRGRVAAEEGLTIIEMAVAFGILFISLLALARTATVAFSDTANSRQRQTGNQFSNQLLEQVAALPWESIQKGLSSSDLGGDPNIVNCSGVYRYKACTGTAPVGEEIAHTPGLSDIVPLVPHTGTASPTDPNFEGLVGTYSWRVYVTKPVACAAGSTLPAGCIPSAGGVRVIALTDWEDRARQGLRSEMEAQTIKYSPTGCVDDATHTVTGPCSAYFYGTGIVGGGTVTTTGTLADGDEPFDSLSLTLLSGTADAQLENTLRVEGDVTMPSLARVEAGVPTVVTDSAASAADTDAATPSGTYQTDPVGPQSSGTITLNDSGEKLHLNIGSGSTGASTSATAAGGASSCNLQVDARPCGFTTGTQSGTMSQTLDLKDAGFATVVSVGSSTTPVTNYVRRSQPVAGESGLIRETVVWNLPEIRVGGIPDEIVPPASWAGYWVRLTGFSATAVSEAGVSTAAPTVTINGGTIQVWHGNGYNSYPVTAAAGTAATTTFSQKTRVSGDWQQVDISGEVSWGESKVTEVVSGANRTEAKATIGSPLIVDMDYVVTSDDEVMANFNILVTAGRGEASTRYQAGGA
jgi:hypothetical protein